MSAGHIATRPPAFAGRRPRAAHLAARREALHVLPVVCAVGIGAALWLSLPAAASLDLRAATDVGVLELLPLSYWAGLALLTIVFAALVVRPAAPAWLLGACLIAAVVILFGISPLASDIPRINVSLRHVGITDSLIRQRAPDPGVDAYFNWPGFFMLAAFLSESAGLDPMSFTRWAPVYTNLAFLPPLLLIARALVHDVRRQWLAIWLYYLGQWVSQDYFAPQSFTYFAFLVVLAVVLTWFRRPPGRRLAGRRLTRRPHRRAGAALQREERSAALALSPAARGGLFALTGLIAVGTVPSHQLTPFAILLGLVALAILDGRMPAVLAGALALALVAWLAFMTTAYLGGHLGQLLENFFDLTAASTENVAARVEGSPGHVVVVRLRLALTGLLWVLAVAGWIRRARSRARETRAVALAAAAYALLPLQPYGGEMLLRAHFFSLPFVAVLATAVIFPSPGAGRRRWLSAGCVVALTAILLPAFVIARYGNARIEQFTPEELMAAETLYDLAEPGSDLFALSNNAPWRFAEYEQHRHRTVTTMWPATSTAAAVAAAMTAAASDTPEGAYFFVSRSQEAYIDLLKPMPPAAAEELERLLVEDGGWQLVSWNRDARIYEHEGSA